eukprot:m.355350 g.355350  ORF g.355350 m.355350 type:complete len:427 (+) comp17228_c0_seq1:308-1588(+)
MATISSPCVVACLVFVLACMPSTAYGQSTFTCTGSNTNTIYTSSASFITGSSLNSGDCTMTIQTTSSSCFFALVQTGTSYVLENSNVMNLFEGRIVDSDTIHITFSGPSQHNLMVYVLPFDEDDAPQLNICGGEAMADESVQLLRSHTKAGRRDYADNMDCDIDYRSETYSRFIGVVRFSDLESVDHINVQQYGSSEETQDTVSDTFFSPMRINFDTDSSVSYEGFKILLFRVPIPNGDTDYYVQESFFASLGYPNDDEGSGGGGGFSVAYVGPLVFGIIFFCVTLNTCCKICCKCSDDSSSTPAPIQLHTTAPTFGSNEEAGDASSLAESLPEYTAQDPQPAPPAFTLTSMTSFTAAPSQSAPTPSAPTVLQVGSSTYTSSYNSSPPPPPPVLSGPPPPPPVVSGPPPGADDAPPSYGDLFSSDA